MELSRRQIKLLKYIAKPKTVKEICQRFHYKDYDDFKYLLIYQNQVLFSWESDPITPETRIQATDFAIAFVSRKSEENLRFIIPTIIALVSLIISILSFICK